MVENTGQGLWIKYGSHAAMLDPGLVLDANNVGVLVLGHWEPWVGEESSSDGVGRQLIGRGALEASLSF